VPVVAGPYPDDPTRAGVGRHDPWKDPPPTSPPVAGPAAEPDLDDEWDDEWGDDEFEDEDGDFDAMVAELDRDPPGWLGAIQAIGISILVASVTIAGLAVAVWAVLRLLD
jgi:hypothetical protein